MVGCDVALAPRGLQSGGASGRASWSCPARAKGGTAWGEAAPRAGLAGRLPPGVDHMDTEIRKVPGVARSHREASRGGGIKGQGAVFQEIENPFYPRSQIVFSLSIGQT